MRLLLLQMLVVAFLSAASQADSIKLDHVGICGYELKSLQDAFASVGLSAEYGGVHATGGTHNALLGFDDGSYLELIALQKPGSATGKESERWSSLKSGDARTCFWAIHTEDLKRLIDSFRKAKVEIGDPQPGSRKKTDGTLLKWDTASVPDAKGGDILPFAIQDITPRTSRITPSASVKGSELTGVKRVVIGVKDLGQAIEVYRKAFNLEEPKQMDDMDFGAKLAYFADTPVVLAASLSPDLWLAQHINEFGEQPIAVLIGTKDLKKTSARAALVNPSSWFNHEVAWFPQDKVEGVRLGIIAEELVTPKH